MAQHKFLIPVTWTVAADMEIYAESLDEARDLAQSKELPEGNYCDGSFEIQDFDLDELNQGSIECCQVDDTPAKDRPLLIGKLLTKQGQAYLEEVLKGGPNG